MCSGFLAGNVYNLWSYPLDTYKTHLQSGKELTIRQFLKSKFWRQKSYIQGMGIVTLRGLIVDCTNFVVYERSRNFA